MRTCSFRTRLVLSFLGVLTLFQAMVVVLVYVVGSRSARHQIDGDLRVTGRVFERLIEVRYHQLSESARVLASDFAFKTAVATGDHATVLSAMQNHSARINAQLMMLVGLDLRVIADTARPQARATVFGFPELIHQAERADTASGLLVIDGSAYQVVVLPMLAPVPIAWVLMGSRLNDAVATELQRLTASDISFLYRTAAGVTAVGASTLPASLRHPLGDVLVPGFRKSGATSTVDLGGVKYVTLAVPFGPPRGPAVLAVLQRPMAVAMEPFRRLQLTLAMLSAGALLVSVAVSLWIARGVSAPVGVLAEAAREVESGHYQHRVRLEQSDELGHLAVAFNAMATGIAEREDHLREGEERFRAITESAPDAIVTADRDGTITSWNESARAIFGYTKEEALGEPLTLLMPPRYRAAHTEGLQRFRAGRDPRVIGKTVELHGLRKDGTEFPLELSLATWNTRNGVSITGIIRDTTERKQLEEQFRQAQKMESLGRLAGGIAHDFNNLLTVIGGHGQLLERKLESESPLRRHVELIHQATTRASALTRQLLAFSRKQVLEPKVLDLSAVVERLEPLLRRLIGEDIHVVTTLTSAGDRVKADPTQIEQIVMNLAVNARDAMSEGGTLTVHTETAELDEAYARRHVGVRPGPYVLLAVSDTGTGMDETTRLRIFEPFFTTKGPGKGTGLGLATVYGIVRQSGGHISVFSEPGRGTTFRIYLPRVEERADAVEAFPAPAPVSPGSETVLLVEDEAGVLELAREILRREGYTVLEARHGEEALIVSGRHSGPIDILLTDVVMPQLNGPALVKRLGPARPEMKVLYMSGYTDDVIEGLGVTYANDPFLHKPFTADTLAHTLREVLGVPLRPVAV